jgi:hypothetical protein
MENNSDQSSIIEIEVSKYKKAKGEVPNIYPFTFSNKYENELEASYLILNPDQTYNCQFIIKFLPYLSHTTFRSCGVFSYDLENRKLILKREDIKMYLGSGGNSLKNLKNYELLPSLINQYFPESIEINNFCWISSSISFPIIYLQKLNKYSTSIHDYEKDYDLNNYLRSSINLNVVCNGLNEFDSICDYIDVLSSSSYLANFLPNPVIYENTTLDPCGAFTMKAECCDDDASTLSKSEVNLSGSWTYDEIKRELTLTYNNFYICEDGKAIGESDFCLFPGKTVTTSNFYFESNYIKALKCEFYSMAPKISEKWVKKKI